MKAYRISVIEVKCGFKISGSLRKKGELDNILSHTVHFVLHQIFIEYSALIHIRLFFLKGRISRGWEEKQRKLCVSLERFSNLAVHRESLRNLFRVGSWALSLKIPITSLELQASVVTSFPGSSLLVTLRPHSDLSCSGLPTVPGGSVCSCCSKEFWNCCRTLKLV